MKTHRTTCSTATDGPFDLVDITDDVRRAVESSGITEGQVTIFSPDPACSVVVNEKESGLFADLARAAQTLPRGHDVLVGSASLVLPLADHDLRLGMWQRILLVELGHGDRRSVDVHVVGE